MYNKETNNCSNMEIQTSEPTVWQWTESSYDIQIPHGKHFMYKMKYFPKHLPHILFTQQIHLISQSLLKKRTQPLFIRKAFKMSEFFMSTTQVKLKAVKNFQIIL